MPPEAMCPFCTTVVPDWHFEWHAQEDQIDIYAGKKTMECPFCRNGVAFDGFVVFQVESEHALAKRDILKAARWARNQDRSLRDYLQTKEGTPYGNLWTETEIDIADQSASAETE